jgi:hypothetical protein
MTHSIVEKTEKLRLYNLGWGAVHQNTLTYFLHKKIAIKSQIP